METLSGRDGLVSRIKYFVPTILSCSLLVCKVLDLHWPNVKSYHWFYLNQVQEIPSRTPSQIRHAQFVPGTQIASHPFRTPLQLPPPPLSSQLSTEGHPLSSPIGGQTLTDGR